MLQYFGLALAAFVLAAAADVRPAAPGKGAVTVSVTRRDLRPLPGVTLQLAEAANRQA